MAVDNMESTETRWQRHIEAGKRYASQGDYAQAEQALLASVKEALTLGQTDLRVAASLGILGKLKQKQGEPERAEALMRRALSVREQALGAENYALVPNINDLGALYYSLGQLDRAESLFARALAITERQLPPDHAELGMALYNLARVYFKGGKPLLAEPLLVRLLGSKERTLGPGHPDVASILTALARVRSTTGHHAEAEQMARRALAIREQALAPDDPALAISLDLVAHFCAGRAKREQLAADAERILRGGSEAAKADAELANTLRTLGEEERSLRERAHAIRARLARPTEPPTLERNPGEVSASGAAAGVAAAPTAIGQSAPLAAPAESATVPVALPHAVTSAPAAIASAPNNASPASASPANASAANAQMAVAPTVNVQAPIAPMANGAPNGVPIVTAPVEGEVRTAVHAATRADLVVDSASVVVVPAGSAPVMDPGDEVKRVVMPMWKSRGFRPSLIAALALAMLVSGGVGLVVGRHQHAPASAGPAAADEGIAAQSRSGSLAPEIAQRDGDALLPPHYAIRSGEPSINADTHPAAPKLAPLPSKRELRHLNTAVERASTRAATRAKLRADSIARTVDLHPPKFGNP